MEFLYQIRRWEDAYYVIEEIDKVVEVINKHKLPLEVVKYITLEYTRFKEEMYNQLKEFL